MHTRFLIIAFVIFSCHKLVAQTMVADSIVALQSPLEESSGLVLVDGNIVTHGDSGNPPALYQIDTLTGTTNRTVYVGNATNVDWEDICKDSTHIYIGDFGNNQGTRQDLKIYKVLLADYQNTANDTVLAEVISFNYADQTNFTPAPFQTNFDAEGLVAFGDSLYVFTKQWSKPGTTVYSLPKTPGSYTIHKVDSMQTSGLVTGADLDPSGLLGVISHTNNYAILLVDYGWYPGKADGPFRVGFFLQIKGSLQVEGIAIKNAFSVYLSSETGLLGDGILSRTTTPLISIAENAKTNVLFYPNPCTGTFKIKSRENIEEIQVIDFTGRAIEFQQIDNTIYLNKKGVFVIWLKNSEGLSFSEIIVVQ